MPDIFSPADPYLEEYKTQTARAAQTASSAITLPDLLTKTLNEKLAGSPIIQERSQAAGNFLRELGNAPVTVLPESMGGVVLTPAEQERIISSRRISALVPLMTANQRYDLLAGQIPDIVGQASRAAQAQAQLAQSQADLAGDIYKTIIDRITRGEELNLKRQALALRGATAGKKKTAAEQKLVEANASIDLALDRIQRVRQSMVGGASGIIPGAQSWLQRIFGGGLPPQVASLNAALSQLNKGVFETAGKAFTKPEAELLAGSIPKVKDDPQIIETQLSALESDLRARKALLELQGLPGILSPDDTADITADEWEVVSY